MHVSWPVGDLFLHAVQELEVPHGHLAPLWSLRESCCCELGHMVLLDQLQAVPLRVTSWLLLCREQRHPSSRTEKRDKV